MVKQKSKRKKSKENEKARRGIMKERIVITNEKVKEKEKFINDIEVALKQESVDRDPTAI